MLQSSILRPGILVNLSITMRGNVSYRTIDLGTEIVDGKEVSKWDTERTTRDKNEKERGDKARSKARSIISGVCMHTRHGLLCLQADRGKLMDAIRDARRTVDDFNMDATVSTISMSVVTGEIAPSDQLAIQGIKRELRELMEDMEEGMRLASTKPQEAIERIREAADKATAVGKMLTPGTQETLERAIKAARATARQLVKAGEQVTLEIDRASIARVTEARTAFLDLDDQADIGGVDSAPRAVDFEPVDPDLQALGVVGTQTRTFEL